MTDDIISKWAEIVKTAWENENFKRMLLDNPTEVLRAAGIDPGVDNVQVHEDSAGVRHFVLPARPGDVTVEEAHQGLLSDANPGF